jgi:hypothetical protein
MDAGGVLAGGVVGGAATLAGTLLSARLVERREHRTWLREKRTVLYREASELAIAIQDAIIEQTRLSWRSDGLVIDLFTQLYTLHQSAAVLLGSPACEALNELWLELNEAMRVAKTQGRVEGMFVPFWGQLEVLKQLAERDLQSAAPRTRAPASCPNCTGL